MKRRRWLVHALRVVFSAGFLFLAYKLIRFDDEYVVSKKTHVPVGEVRPEGDGYRVRDRWFPKGEVELREGFLSLFRRIDRKLFFMIAPLFLVPFFVVSLRWWLLLRGHGFDSGPGTVFAVTYIGGFFNNFLPGSVGGDIARGVIAARGEDRKAALVGTILLDRLVGLAAMIVMATACVLPFAHEARLRTPVILVLSLFGAMVAGYFAYFSRFLRDRFQWLKRGRFGGVVSGIDGAVKMAKDKKGLMLASGGLSILSQSMSILLIFGLARALGIDGVHLYQFFIFEPIIFIVTAVPISLGGWGVQEGAYAVLFGFAGVPPNEAVALSVLYKLTLILISLPGGILFAFGVGRKSESRADPQIG